MKTVVALFPLMVPDFLLNFLTIGPPNGLLRLRSQGCAFRHTYTSFFRVTNHALACILASILCKVEFKRIFSHRKIQFSPSNIEVSALQCKGDPLGDPSGLSGLAFGFDLR